MKKMKLMLAAVSAVLVLAPAAAVSATPADPPPDQTPTIPAEVLVSPDEREVDAAAVVDCVSGAVTEMAAEATGSGIYFETKLGPVFPLEMRFAGESRLVWSTGCLDRQGWQTIVDEEVLYTRTDEFAEIAATMAGLGVPPGEMSSAVWPPLPAVDSTGGVIGLTVAFTDLTGAPMVADCATGEVAAGEQMLSEGESGGVAAQVAFPVGATSRLMSTVGDQIEWVSPCFTSEVWGRVQQEGWGGSTTTAQLLERITTTGATGVDGADPVWPPPLPAVLVEASIRGASIGLLVNCATGAYTASLSDHGTIGGEPIVDIAATVPGGDALTELVLLTPPAVVARTGCLDAGQWQEAVDAGMLDTGVGYDVTELSSEFAGAFAAGFSTVDGVPAEFMPTPAEGSVMLWWPWGSRTGYLSARDCGSGEFVEVSRDAELGVVTFPVGAGSVELAVSDVGSVEWPREEPVNAVPMEAAPVDATVTAWFSGCLDAAGWGEMAAVPPLNGDMGEGGVSGSPADDLAKFVPAGIVSDQHAPLLPADAPSVTAGGNPSTGGATQPADVTDGEAVAGPAKSVGERVWSTARMVLLTLAAVAATIALFIRLGSGAEFMPRWSPWLEIVVFAGTMWLLTHHVALTVFSVLLAIGVTPPRSRWRSRVDTLSGASTPLRWIVGSLSGLAAILFVVTSAANGDGWVTPWQAAHVTLLVGGYLFAAASMVVGGPLATTIYQFGQTFTERWRSRIDPEVREAFAETDMGVRRWALREAIPQALSAPATAVVAGVWVGVAALGYLGERVPLVGDAAPLAALVLVAAAPLLILSDSPRDVLPRLTAIVAAILGGVAAIALFNWGGLAAFVLLAAVIVWSIYRDRWRAPVMLPDDDDFDTIVSALESHAKSLFDPASAMVRDPRTGLREPVKMHILDVIAGRTVVDVDDPETLVSTLDHFPRDPDGLRALLQRDVLTRIVEIEGRTIRFYLPTVEEEEALRMQRESGGLILGEITEADAPGAPADPSIVSTAEDRRQIVELDWD